MFTELIEKFSVFGNNTEIYYSVLEYKFYQMRVNLPSSVTGHHIVLFVLSSGLDHKDSSWKQDQTFNSKCVSSRLASKCIGFMGPQDWNPEVLGPLLSEAQDSMATAGIPFHPRLLAWLVGVSQKAGLYQSRKSRLAKQVVHHKPLLCSTSFQWHLNLKPKSCMVWPIHSLDLFPT